MRKNRKDPSPALALTVTLWSARYATPCGSFNPSMRWMILPSADRRHRHYHCRVPQRKPASVEINCQMIDPAGNAFQPNGLFQDQRRIWGRKWLRTIDHQHGRSNECQNKLSKSIGVSVLLDESRISLVSGQAQAVRGTFLREALYGGMTKAARGRMRSSARRKGSGAKPESRPHTTLRRLRDLPQPQDCGTDVTLQRPVSPGA